MRIASLATFAFTIGIIVLAVTSSTTIVQGLAGIAVNQGKHFHLMVIERTTLGAPLMRPMKVSSTSTMPRLS